MLVASKTGTFSILCPPCTALAVPCRLRWIDPATLPKACNSSCCSPVSQHSTKNSLSSTAISPTCFRLLELVGKVRVVWKLNLTKDISEAALWVNLSFFVQAIPVLCSQTPKRPEVSKQESNVACFVLFLVPGGSSVLSQSQKPHVVLWHVFSECSLVAYSLSVLRFKSSMLPAKGLPKILLATARQFVSRTCRSSS